MRGSAAGPSIAPSVFVFSNIASQCAAPPAPVAAVPDCSGYFVPLTVLLLAVFIFMLGVAVGWLASNMTARGKPTHNVLTQSTVTHTWWTNEPRFLIGPADHYSWLSARIGKIIPNKK